MSKGSLFVGNEKARFGQHEIKGTLIEMHGETFYKISNCDRMRPFFMSIVSDSDHWMFIASNGGLTAGRKNAESALFPYYTDDKITESAEYTGSKSILRVKRNAKTYLWEPFSDRYEGIYGIRRNLYKNSYGNKIIFEEINDDLELTFRYEWNSSNQYGFIKKSSLVNTGDTLVEVTLLDGIQNVLPHGVNADLQGIRSNLVDAYKKNELLADSGVGVYALSAIIVDRAEPSEALMATTCWSLGLDDPTYLLSSLQLKAFRQGADLTQEEFVKAEKGAYFVSSSLALKPKENKKWLLVTNVNQRIADILKIADKIKKNDNLAELIEKDIVHGHKGLVKLTAASDGLQKTADKLRNTRHFSNTLFNIMRGGIFDNNYQIEKGDFLTYLTKANKNVAKDAMALLDELADSFSLSELKKLAAKSDNNDFQRLCVEYLPLKFSRRHGDPSRPWNKFSINTRDEIDGSKILDYEGNWRDIFQNWEALVHSYPEFIDGMVHKFLNASTFDGYNPYRVTKDGFDWEIIEPHDPWSYIGYWGDHQIIYLLKFLEFIEDHYPGRLASYFGKEYFVYANVPYKIKSYQDILKNSKDTIEFDEEVHNDIVEKRKNIGADGALLRAKDSSIVKVDMIEKLLAPVLAKLSNFIPEGGIWMNTQRPEWNDANNALVGNGVSMVTLYYLRRFLKFFSEVLAGTTQENTEISKELNQYFEALNSAFSNYMHLIDNPISDVERKQVLDALGIPASDYRINIYNNAFSGEKSKLSLTKLKSFIETANAFLEHTIRANKRSDNMYHAYNIMTLNNDNGISLGYLSEMLEGQVAILSSGYISTNEAIELLDGLKASALFRPDQYSYLLYPAKNLLPFVEKNNIPKKRAESSMLIKTLIDEGNLTVVERDHLGSYHFNGTFNNANSLKEALYQLPNKYQHLVEEETRLLLEIFEEVFDHKSFTGRSGTFYGYEGLGSIYWHMVSKLLLAVQEVTIDAINNNEPDELIGRLFDHYYEIEAGIGVDKSPELYGAFPTDPYSHTPSGKGAQQPGMTGQVKEDFLSRYGELGISVKHGELQFRSKLLRDSEYLTEIEEFKFMDVHGTEKSLELGIGELCFTYCQVPVTYKKSDKNTVEVRCSDKSVLKFDELKIPARLTAEISNRSGFVKDVKVFFKA